ncbi:MAG TPA: ABC transporter substrate-binding protein [Polyangiaceae bacterium]|nr:ABC transporter substrate-binding protein [Polyangiaceae bacterium]
MASSRHSGRRVAMARLVFLVAFAAGATLSACSKRDSGGLRPMVIGVSTLRISLPVFVAEQHGLFAKHGIDAEVRRYETAQPLADELGAGRIDAGGYVAFPILFGPGAPPPKVRVLTAVVEDRAHPLSYLLVKKGSGLRGVAALRGRRIGILPTAAYRRWLEAILVHDGLRPEDVTIVPLAPPLEADALAGGGVDALFTGDPMATAALARGLAEPATDTPDVPRVLGEPFLFGTFAVTENFAQKHPETARALAAALDEAIALIAADPAVGTAAMKPYVRENERPFVDRYPAARYLGSREITAAQLDRALELAGTDVRAATVTLP